MRKGFTLIELCYVMALTGLMAALTVPAYDVLLRRARVAEARTTIHAIAHAELRHLRDRGAYVACGPTSDDVPLVAVPFPSDLPCWRDLGIHPEGLVRYRYAVTVDASGFVVTAEGDLDADGVPSRFSLRGEDLSLTIVDELE